MQFNQKYLNIIKEQFPIKPSGMTLKKWLEQHQDIKQYLYSLIDRYESFTCIGNVWKCLYQGIDVDTIVCKHCGKPIKMTSTNIIHEYCCVKCAANDDEKKQHNKETISKDKNYYAKRQQKIEQTNIKKYGVKAPAMNETIVQKMQDVWKKNPNIWNDRTEKIVKTVQEKYGVDNISQSEQIKHKKKQTIQKHYGVLHQMLSTKVKDQVKQTCLDRYGVDNIFKSDKCRQISLTKSWNTIKTWKDYVIPNFTREDYTGYSKKELEWKCVKCGFTFKQRVYSTKFASHISDLIPRCIKCFPVRNTASACEMEIVNFCEQCGCNVIKHDRNIINPYELDILIPDKKIAIEFDGMYWHSDAIDRITKDYHLNKTEACKQKGYKLIHIFEYDWMHNQNIIKSKLKSMFGLYQTKIYARKCIIKQLNDVSVFLNENHIQGCDKSKVKLGLYFNDELVAVMTFGKPRFNKKYQYELIRYATKSEYHVLGGAGKLLKYFERVYNPKSIVTYADRRYSQGDMYFKLGFVYLYNSQPNYCWTKDQYCLTRYQCQKNKLKNVLGEDKFNPNISENENMRLNGWNKIYDCGNMVFEKLKI